METYILIALGVVALLAAVTYFETKKQWKQKSHLYGRPKTLDYARSFFCLIGDILRGALNGALEEVSGNANKPVKGKGRQVADGDRKLWLVSGTDVVSRGSHDPKDTWIFDGKEIRLKYGPTPDNQWWVWDGKQLEPKCGSGSNVWLCTESELRPKLNANSSNTWKFDGRHIQLKYGSTPDDMRWQWDGTDLRKVIQNSSSKTWLVDRRNAKAQLGHSRHNSLQLPLLGIFAIVILRIGN